MGKGWMASNNKKYELAYLRISLDGLKDYRKGGLEHLDNMRANFINIAP
jgi:hypothetical protein